MENEKKKKEKKINLIKGEVERLAFENRLELMIENSEKVLSLQIFLQASEPTGRKSRNRRPKNV